MLTLILAAVMGFSVVMGFAAGVLFCEFMRAPEPECRPKRRRQRGSGGRRRRTRAGRGREVGRLGGESGRRRAGGDGRNAGL